MRSDTVDWACARDGVAATTARVAAGAAAKKRRRDIGLMLLLWVAAWSSRSRQRDGAVGIVLASSHAGAKQALVGHSQSAADLASDVHLEQGKLLDILLVDLVEARGGQLDRRAFFDRHHRRASREQIHQRHLAEAIAFAQMTQQAMLPRPQLQHRHLAFLQDEHRVGLFVLVKEELPFRYPLR